MQPDFCSTIPVNTLYGLQGDPSLPGTEHVQSGRRRDVLSLSLSSSQYSSGHLTGTQYREMAASLQNVASSAAEMDPSLVEVQSFSFMGGQLAFRICEELQLEEVIMLKEVRFPSSALSLCTNDKMLSVEANAFHSLMPAHTLKDVKGY